MSANTSEALPCPFCGSVAEHGFVTGMSFHWYVRCSNDDCRARIEHYARSGRSDTDPAKQTSLAAWNTRAQSAELASLRARLQTAETWRDLHEASAKVERAATDDLLHEVEWMRRNAPLAYSHYRVITAERAKEGGDAEVRIIKHGRDPKAGVIHRLKCVSCKTVFEFEAHEAQTVPDQRDGDFYQIACPVCGRLCTKNIDKRHWL